MKSVNNIMLAEVLSVGLGDVIAFRGGGWEIIKYIEMPNAEPLLTLRNQENESETVTMTPSQMSDDTFETARKAMLEARISDLKGCQEYYKFIRESQADLITALDKFVALSGEDQTQPQLVMKTMAYLSNIVGMQRNMLESIQSATKGMSQDIGYIVPQEEA